MDKIPAFVANHWDLFLITALILVALFGLPLLNRARGLLSADTNQALRLINRENALVLDTREDSEYQSGHIVDSQHVPLSRLDKDIARLEKHKQRPTIVVCATGSRSSRAGGILRRHGFEKVYNLKGGIMAWSNANLPLSRK
jgi:rhodanese-related sulfurtransferase